jgi:hypothetical protein
MQISVLQLFPNKKTKLMGSGHFYKGFRGDQADVIPSGISSAPGDIVDLRTAKIVQKEVSSKGVSFWLRAF